MGKSHCDHRVVIRNQADDIILDKAFENFASAKPYYEQHAHSLNKGHVLTLQHGARVVCRTTRDDKGVAIR